MKAAPVREYDDAPMGQEATQLMHAVKHGDRAAFDRLVERTRTRAFHLAHALVGSRDDAMELAQEAFLKIYRSRDTYKDGEPFLPWFQRVVRNTCFSFLRSKGRLRARSVSDRAPGADADDTDYEIVDDGAAPDGKVLADERAAAFHQAFATLSSRDREILALRHFQECSYKEIAQALAIPEGTVMSRLFHARRRLRDVLGAGFGDEIEGDDEGGDG
ncbi:MAG: RNA polymerase sigma factor [Planctomycetes bacterium]|nr:RNA polymerase sigma factor [Planctomycetota bacterium]